jgi:uncharacterized protein (DUF58 family)
VKFFKALFFTRYFFAALMLASILFFVSYFLPGLYSIAWIFIWIIVLAVIIDIITLFKGKPLSATRELPDKLSNSDANQLEMNLQNHFPFQLQVEVIDEIPEQFQKRDFKLELSLKAYEETKEKYFLTPRDRGVYHFGRLHCFCISPMRLIKRKVSFDKSGDVKVYPSFIQMRKYDFLSLAPQHQIGIKKVRRIGHTMEFEQIKEYVKGDDIRTINWKATSKRAKLMVNQYQDERSQSIFSVIDQGRVMQMPFNGLSLLEYSINAALSFSNIALKKKDKTGVVSFSNKIDQLVKPSANKTQLTRIMESLYSVDTDFSISDFGNLYIQLKRQLSHRSLLFIYTNFEHLEGMRRQLPYIKALAKKHLLVIVLFENIELQEIQDQKVEKVFDVYVKTIAEEMDNDKQVMAQELERNGVFTMLTRPEDLTVNAINKYLEIKSRGIL